MAYKTISGGNARRLEVDESVEGILVQVDHNQGQKKNSNIYHIKTPTGTQQIWGAKLIDDVLGESEDCVQVRLTFKGKIKSQSGGNDFNMYLVEVDDEADLGEFAGRKIAHETAEKSPETEA